VEAHPPHPGGPGAEARPVRREGVLRAAAAEAAASGLAGVTLASVAQRAGVARGALQGLFGSEEDLLGDLGRWLMSALIAEGGRAS
jgi:AcrR family transcriptional regulator